MTPRLGSRDLFPDLRPPVYLNHAGISPLSRRVQQAVVALMARYGEEGLGALPAVIAEREDLRGRLAALMGVSAAQIALTEGTSRGVSDIALGFPWQKGDGVLLFEGEFPANITPWQQAAALFGLELRWASLEGFGDGSGDGLARVEAALKEAPVRLIAVSAVQFQTGLAMPLGALADLAHAHGAALFVDGIQGAGVVPYDLRALGVDFFVCGAHKGWMASEGAGFAYIADPAALRPFTASWLSHTEGLRFLSEGPGLLRYDRPLRDDAAVLEGGVRNVLGFGALGAAIEAHEQLGIRAIFGHVQAYHDALEPLLIEAGFESERTADPSARSSILAARPPRGWTVGEVAQALGAAGVMVGTPDGRVRFAPHWPNSIDELPQIAAALATIRAGDPTRSR